MIRIRHGTNTALTIPLLTLLIILSIILATGFQATNELNPQLANPSIGDNISGNVTFEVGVSTTGDTNITNVTFSYNTSVGGKWTTFMTKKNTSKNQASFNTTNYTGSGQPHALTISDGLASFNITAHNRTHVTVNDTYFTVTVDNTDPSLTPTLPINNANISGTFAVNATWGDATSGINAVMYNITAFTFPGQPNGSLVRTGVLNDTNIDSTAISEGDYVVSYNATDAAGNLNVSIAARNITVDNTGFTVTVHQPENVSTTNTSVDLKVTADDAVSVWQYSVDGGTNKSFSADNTTTLTPGEGTHTVTVWANDSADNKVSADRTFTIDTTPPTVTIHSPANANVSDDTPLLGVTANEGIDTWLYNVGLESTNQSFTPNTSLSSLSEGTYNVTVWANDTVGFYDKRTRVFSVDLTPPKGTDDLNVTSDTFNALSRLSDLIVYQVGTFSAASFTWVNYTGSEIEEVSSTMTSGLSGLELWARNRSFDTDTQSLGSFGEWVRLNGSIPNASTAWNNTTVSLDSNHEYKFDLRTVDQAGNYNSSNTINLTVDNTAPQFSTDSGNVITTPFNWTNTNVTFTANITDLVGIHNATTGASKILFFYNGSSEPHANYSVSLTPGTNNSNEYQVTADDEAGFLPNDEGDLYNVTIQATDRFGNTANRSWAFSTDFTDPLVDSVVTVFGQNVSYTRGNGDTWYKGSVTAQVDCSDELSGASAVRASYNNSNDVTGWNETIPGNISLTGSGDYEYTFDCKDEAGNINSTGAQTADEKAKKRFRIDSIGPADKQSLSSPAEGDEGVSQGSGVSFTVLFHNESDESWVNTSASSLELHEGPGSITISSWTNWSVSGTMTLDNFDESYEIDGTIVDNVGNTGSVDVDFRTEKNTTSTSSTTQTQTSGSSSSPYALAWSDVPSSVSLVAGGFVSFTVELENTGTLDQSGMDIDFVVSEVTVEDLYPTGMDLLATNTSEVTVNLSAPTGIAANTYEGNLTVISDQDVRAFETVDVEVGANTPDLGFAADVDTVDVNRGGFKKVSFTVENTGGSLAEDVAFSVAADNVTATPDPKTANISAGEARFVNLSVIAPDAVPMGIYEATLEVTHPASNISHTFEVKVGPASEREKKKLDRELAALERFFNETKTDLNESDAEEIESLMEEARAAFQDEDYAKAADVKRQIEKKLPNRNSFPLWVVGVVLVIFAAGGLAAYMVVPEPGGRGPYPTIQDFTDEGRRHWKRVRGDRDEESSSGSSDAAYEYRSGRMNGLKQRIQRFQDDLEQQFDEFRDQVDRHASAAREKLPAEREVEKYKDEDEN